MSMVALSTFLTKSPADNPVIAMRAGLPLRFDRFKHDVSQLKGHFKQQSTAALVCRDSYNFAVGFFGLLHAGARVIIPSGTQQILSDCQIATYDVVVDDAYIKKVEGHAQSLTAIDAERTTLHFFTSGSTGDPKPIAKNLSMLEIEIAVLQSLWGDQVGTVVSTVSHQHIYGLTFKLLWSLASGRPFGAETHLLWEDLIDALPSKATLISSPAHLSRMGGLSSVALTRPPLSIFSAGAPLPYEATVECQSIFGSRPREIFGSTETGAIASRQSLGANQEWKPLPGVSLRTDAGGNLEINSPFAGSKWIATSDRVELTELGFIYRGRSDRIAKIEGKRVDLLALEAALHQLAHVEAAAVICIAEPKPALGAVLVLTKGGSLELTQMGLFRFSRLLRDTLAKTMESAGIPRLWRFVDALPDQNLGKRREADLQALFRSAK